MPSQNEKYHMAMAGEYLVAAQLHRLQIAASVTYGNAKSADVIAFSEVTDRAIVIEVKTTRQQQWVVGSKVPLPSPKPWIFVHLPASPIESPQFYILTQRELFDILSPLEQAYNQRYRERNSVEYGDRRRVENVSRKSLAVYENNWSTITDQLKVSGKDIVAK